MFDLLPTRLQQEIRQCLEQNQFTEAKCLYDQYLDSAPSSAIRTRPRFHKFEDCGKILAPVW